MQERQIELEKSVTLNAKVCKTLGLGDSSVIVECKEIAAGQQQGYAKEHLFAMKIGTFCLEFSE